jgi:hypothetical protein
MSETEGFRRGPQDLRPCSGRAGCMSSASTQSNHCSCTAKKELSSSSASNENRSADPPLRTRYLRRCPRNPRRHCHCRHSPCRHHPRQDQPQTSPEHQRQRPQNHRELTDRGHAHPRSPTCGHGVDCDGLFPAHGQWIPASSRPPYHGKLQRHHRHGKTKMQLGHG